MLNRAPMVFLMFLAGLGLFIGIMLFPALKDIVDNVDKTGWDSLLQSYVGIMFIVFLVLVVISSLVLFRR